MENQFPITSGEKIEFEIDRYDIHKVAYKNAERLSNIWQANFMGGGRLHMLLKKITQDKTLNDYLESMVEKREWKVAEGWIESPKSEPLQKINLLTEKDRSQLEIEELADLEFKHKADWITGKPFVETDDFTEEGIKETKICEINYFYRSSKKNKEIFEPPHLIIHESVKNGRVPVILRNDYLTFKDSLFGVYAPENDIEKLNEIKEYLTNKFNIALIWLNSGKVITMREGVPTKGDILSLPYPQVEFNEIDKILLEDISTHYSEFRKEGEKSDILNEVTNDELEDFGIIYCQILNSIYKNFNPLPPIKGKEFIAYPFVLGEQPEFELPNSIGKIEEQLRNLIDNRQSYNLWIKRILKVYHKNVVIFYKPNQKRFWLKSIAIRDADETFIDLYKQGK